MTPVTVDNLVAFAVQAGVLTLAGAPLPSLFGIRSPRARLAYWRALLLGCLLLPALQPWVPKPSSPAAIAAASAEEVTTAATAAPSVVPPPAVSASVPRFDVLDFVAGGIVARTCWFAAGLFTLAGIRRRATRLEPRPASVVEAIGLARSDAEFRVAATRTRPVTFGVFRPVVVVPSDFETFPEGEQKAVACHELVHVRRCDWLRTLGDEAVRAIGWFHPAAWWLTRQIRLAREEVVDEEVVRQLGARKPYLDALLRLAAPDRGSLFVPAPLFLGRSHLARRVTLLLKEVRMSRPRLALSFAVMATLLVMTGRVVVHAVPLRSAAVVVAPARADQAARPGLVLEPTSREPFSLRFASGTSIGDILRFLGGASGIRITVDAGIGELTTMAPIHVERVSLEQALSAILQPNGLSYRTQDAKTVVVFRGTAPTNPAPLGPTSPGKPVQQSFVKVTGARPDFPADSPDTPVLLAAVVDGEGAVIELTVVDGPPELARRAADAVRQWKFSAADTPRTILIGFNPSAASADAANQPVRVGRDVRAPMRVKDVKPVYPSEARDARVEGVVILEAAIATDGTVSEARILRSIPSLDRAALDAVLRWKFSPPEVPVIMTVTVNFTLHDNKAGDSQSSAGGVGGGTGGGVGTGVGGGVGGGVGSGVGGGVGSGVGSGVGGGVGSGVGGGVPGGVGGGVPGGSAARGVPGGVSGAAPGGGVKGGVAGGVEGTAEPSVVWERLPKGERALRVGGIIKPPLKVVDVKPVYPKDARDAGVQGQVLLEVVIGPDGKVKLVTIQHASAALAQAAVDAVRQWEFTPTLMNGVPQNVVMSVTVNFSLE